MISVGGSMRHSILIVTFALSIVIIGCSRKYSEADVNQTEAEIRTQFEQKGLVVEQVSMVKDSDRHMTGFVKFHKSSGLFSKVDVSRNCTAAMDADSGKSLWQCN
jgi:hypothetical protein